MIAWHHPWLIIFGLPSRTKAKVLGHSVGEYAAAVVAGVPLTGTLGMMVKMLRMFVNGNDHTKHIYWSAQSTVWDSCLFWDVSVHIRLGFNTITNPETSLLSLHFFLPWSKITTTKWVSTDFPHIGAKSNYQAMNLGPGVGRCRSLDCSTGTSYCGEMRSRGALITGWRRPTEKPNKILLWSKKAWNHPDSQEEIDREK